MTIIKPMAGAVVVSAFLGLPAVAGQITAANPEDVLKAMQNFGLVATLTKDQDGDPEIDSRVSKSEFHVLFFGCENNKNCTSIELRAAYDLKDPLSASFINEWNRDKRFTRAYIDDEGDPFIEMDLNLAFDGDGEKNFEDTLDWWRVSLETFEEFIDW